MASIHKRGNTWQIRWQEPDGCGTLRQRGRTVHTADAARRLLREVQFAEDLGQRWEPAQLRRIPGVEQVAEAWLREISATLRPRTAICYGQRLDLLVMHLQEATGRSRVSVADLSRQTLADGHAWLLARGQSRGTARGVLMTWEQWWRWAWESEAYATDVPRPHRLRLREAPPVDVASPTWAEVDAMIEQLGQRRHCREGPDWELRCATIARYTGMRLSAVLQLEWSDIDLDRALIAIRAETTKGGRSGRTIPLHPALAKELAGWGVRQGRICPWTNLNLAAAATSMCTRSASAWAKTTARPAVYQGRPDHCMRRCLRTHLSASGVAPDVIDTITGHRRQGTGGRTYTDPGFLWPLMMDAISKIPAIGTSTPAVPMRRAGPIGP